MSGPSNLVSVRIPDDELSLLDEHVGTQGMRSRSDVIRRALRSLFETQPTHESMKCITVELGTSQQFKLAHLHQMEGTSTEAAINIALNTYLDQVIGIINPSNEQYESTAAELRQRVSRSKEFKQ
ncbi:MAG: ribbon-helix-helix domain-containing protein [Candidatus Poseidoniaceae archaeon]|jgi:Arc/MetJ-type ribon-helix-helix transcriptional regulator|nr:ribbon-helix-helix domain-containing protein [Candidatus Poseidoniaceae archaeon]